MNGIAQNDPRQEYLALRAEIDEAIARVLLSGRYILGGEVAAFESEFASYNGTAHAIGVANGTDAIELALRAAGIGSGDCVITVANTAVATAAAIERAGARVAFADVDRETLTIDPASVEALLARGEERYRAIVPVHLFGRCADVEAILAIAERHALAVIEDCAQAHGATRNGRRAGASGVAAAFSFYPTKNLGALGDGGAVVTSDEALAERVRLLRQYGWRERDRSLVAGMNSRLDELQAAVLRAKLRALDAGNARRRLLAEVYDRALGALVKTPATDGGHVHHQYVIRVDDRDALQQSLRDEGITSLVHYPVPIHLQPAYAGRVVLPTGGLPVTERAAGEILSLPMHPHLADEDQARVCAAIERWARAR